MKYRYILVLLSLVFNLSLSAQRIKPLFKCSKRLTDAYGMCAHFTFKDKKSDNKTMEQQSKMLHDLGCTIVRSDLAYYMVNKTNTATLDNVLSVLSKNRLSFLGIATDPRFYNKQWSDDDKYNQLLATIQERYLKKLNYLEFQNEVNFSKVQNLGLNYTNDLKELYSLKRYKRGLKILFSGIADTNYDFLDSVMQYRGYRYFDIMNFHTYRAPEDIPTALEKIETNMKEFHWSKPIWMTECGMHTAVKKGQNEGERIKLEDEQARRVARIHLIAFAYGVDKVFWYKFRSNELDPYYSEDNFGMVHADLSPKPAYYAYKTLIKMLPSGSTRPVLTIKDGIYKAEWKRPDGKKITAYWCKEGATYIKLNAKPTMIVGYMGKNVALLNNSLKVSSGIVYCVK